MGPCDEGIAKAFARTSKGESGPPKRKAFFWGGPRMPRPYAVRPQRNAGLAAEANPDFASAQIRATGYRNILWDRAMKG